ncbi:MAG: hypothetical protein H0T46_03175 [Deltaproteobacteria bacterium]|nr:hypothetical protein [Deltaproteobacteria bacterium]
MRRFPLVACAVLLVASCGKSRQKRAGDAAPVEIVQQPVGGDAGAGSAASTDEIEPNDGDDVATPYALGATARGRIEPETDADFYKLVLNDSGALTVELTAVEGMDLTLEVLDAGGSLLAKSDRGAIKVKEGVPNLGVNPGRYTLVVRAKKPPTAKPTPTKKGAKKPPIDAGVAGPTNTPVYELTARIGAVAANSEREPDDDRGTANDLIVGDTASGFVGWVGDVDVYKLSVEAVSAKNNVDLEVSGVEGVALTVEIADALGKVLMTRKTGKGAPLIVRGLVPFVPSGSPPFHYILVKGTSSNHETAYQLRVLEKVTGPDAEAEPNDTAERAMPVPPDRTVVHGSWTPGDVDFYALPVEQAARSVEITIQPGGDTDVTAEVIVDGKVIAKGERQGKGAEERLTAAVPAGATALLKITATANSAEGTYDISMQDGPAGP